ncbi:MAG: UDP-N-acetyl-D-glucosamine dehydrogenase [Coxiella sp. RIFCSPHIGHO2_12_FULL_44_14]|nr:MAG: UDP-N-acetyl-D-glucosamine dehydrogenase [Coxiella sp. RIFCSPHIGHO2_12_FULL_44_14]
MSKLKTAVVGVGYLGKFHAEKFAQLPSSHLVAVSDVDHQRCYDQAQQHGVEAVIDYQSLIGMVDAVSIAVPTPLHHEVALFFLNHGIHVLLEKPIATTLAEADDLIAAARKNQVVLQIGHLERFNNTVKSVEPLLSSHLRFIESLRLAPFKLRGSDVSVVLDLMIHDIDIIQSMVKADIHRISANGASVLSPETDLANARLEFTNGCVANVTASRISLKTERRLRIFQHDSYIALDLDNKTIAIHRKGTQEMFPGIPEITREILTVNKGDALKDQINAFLRCIIDNTPPIVSAEEGKRALATALEITRIVQFSNQQYPLTSTATR